MSIHHPKQKQIRLPFSVPKPGRSSASSKRICGICRKNDSDYTCPRCNIPYCSLACFKSQAHVQCSEPFYKSTVLDQIAADPKADFDEKKRMLNMLRRFEDSQAEGEDSLRALEEDAGSEDELERALAGVDLDDIESNKLFHLLPQHHRDAFLAAIKDPDSAEAKALLALESARAEEDVPDVLPWWEGDELDDEDDDLQVAMRPPMLASELVSSITPPNGTGLKLVYNTLAITLAYLHTLLSLRLPSLDNRYLKEGKLSVADVKAEIDALVPFLSDQKSTVRYGSVREAWEAVWGTIGETLDDKPSSDVLLRLISILSLLLRPSIMADSPPLVSLALSDLYRLYANPKPGAAVPRKLVFYLACLKQLGREDWLGLQRETDKELAKLQDELGDSEVREEGEEDRPTLRVG